MAVEISTVEELQAMQSDRFGDYVLINDIDASATVGWDDGAGFVPVGQTTGGFDFQGLLDGQGYSIAGLWINRPSESYVGLFGEVGSGAVVENVFLGNCTINGSLRVGAVAGRATSGSIIRYCSASGAVMTAMPSGNAECGGIVGRTLAGTTISDCHCKATVTASNNASRIGGFIGDSRGEIARCYSAGAVVGSGSASGGFAGFQSGATFTGCFWDTQTTGKATSAGGTGKTTAEMKTLATFTGASWGIVSGLDDTKVWGIDPGINDGYPFLQVFQSGSPEPAQGSGAASLTVSTQGEGWRVSSGDGQNTLSVSVVGDGYFLSSGYGESSLTVSTNGEGYAATGSYGETLLIADSSGQGYVIRSGAGLAAMQVGTVGNGQSAEPAKSGILALQTIDGLYLIGF